MNLLLLLDKLKTITKYDKTKLVIYLGITLFIFFFLEKIEFRKIGLIIAIFIGVFIYNSYEDIAEGFKEQNPLRNESSSYIEIDDKHIDKHIQKIKITNNDLTQEVDIDKITTSLKKIKKFIKINVKEVIQTIGNTKFKNKNINIYNNLVKLINQYLQQVRMVLELRDYKHKNFENVINIKKEINIVLHSIVFKVNSNRDKDITMLINTINTTFIEIEDYLKTHIKTQFYEDPTYLSGNVHDEDNMPRAFDDTVDIDCHIVEF
jgi:hypothetical protein